MALVRPNLSLIVEPSDAPADHALSYDALIAEAQLAERQGRRDEARDLYESALRRLGEAPSGAHASAVLRWIARTYQVDARPEPALDCLEAALAVADLHGDLAAVVHAINLQAIVHWQQGDLDEAERLYHAARESALRAGEAKLGAMTAQNLGVIANIRGDLDAALHYYETSLAAYRALGLASDVFVGLNNLGMLYTQRQQWAEALRSFEEAVRIAEVLGDQSTRILIEVNIAECLVAQGALAEARAVCDRAMALSQETHDTRAHGELHKVYGIIAREAGDFPEAERCLALARGTAEARQDLLLLAESTRETAELHRRQGRNRDALQSLNRAHRLFGQLRARRELADIDRRMTELESDFIDVVRRWGESIESKDHYTQGHCERVADIACALAARAGMETPALFWFRIGALLHDVGKLVIPPEVLNKPGALDSDEWALVKQHPAAGVEMLADIDFPWDVRPIVESHHERWDGAGYPHGLRGDAIPLEARILGIADVYDALTSERSYKKALSHADAMDIMRLEAGRQFDPRLFALFEEVAAELDSSGRRVRSAPARVSGPFAAAGLVLPHDELTGLPLRRAFVEEARRALAERPVDESVSLLVIDVDHFKLINDTYGHLAGDAALRTVAQTLQRHLRSGTFLARYAGDEFVLLLPGVTLEDAADIGHRLRTSVHTLPMAQRGSTSPASPASLTLSIGVAAAPAHGATVEALFAAADAALYEAKRAGRDAVVCAGASDAVRTPTLQLDRFTARLEERRRLVGLFERAVRGEPQVVAVVGEAGIGKTALVRELAPEVRLRAGSLVLGRCIDAEARPPFGPWAALLNAIRVLRVVPERHWRELPRLLPALGTAPADDHGGTRFALFEEVAEYLRLAAASRPIVMVFDDMQWADGPSWELLEHVAARLQRERILICITIRDEDVGSDIVGRRARLSRDERFHELRLGRLSRDELRQWVERSLQQEAGQELLAFLYRQTEGNPFFTVQVLRALAEEGSLWWSGERWEWRPVSELRLPTAVRDLISRRLTRLSPHARRTLSAAAVMGRSLDIDLAIAAEIATEDELLDAIDEGLAASVLEASTVRGDERVAFTHGLLVEVLHRSVHPRRLRRIHERVAQALEERAPTAVADIASHYDAAGVGAQAFRYALLAAERAAALYAHDEATAFLQLAERHASNGEELARVRLRQAQVGEMAGRYESAAELCALALDWFVRQGTPAETAECRRMLVRLQSLTGAPPQATCDACAALLQDAERHGLEAERIALLTMISQGRSQLGDAEGAERLARECVQLAGPHGDARLLATTELRLGTAIVRMQPEEALSHYQRAAELFASIDDAYGVLRSEINIGAANSLLGHVEAAKEAYTRALERGHELHSLDLAGIATMNLGALSLKSGRYDLARERLEEAHALFSRARLEHYRLAAVLNLAHLARESGQMDEAARRYAEAAGRARVVGLADIEIGATAGAGLVAFTQGDPTLALGCAAELTRALQRRGESWFQGRELAEALRVHAMLFAGDAAGARAHFRGALALAESHDLAAATWFVADCATALLPGDSGELTGVLRRYAPRATALGLSLLAARFDALLGAVDGDARAGPQYRPAPAAAEVALSA